MEDETLNNILNLLQNTGSNHQSNNTNNSSTNNDLQTLIIKFLLSGGLNQIMNMRNQNNPQPAMPKTPEPTRKIDLSNYQRLD